MPEEDAKEDDKASLLLETVDFLEEGKINDYHAMFNQEYIVDWMCAPLLCLEKRGLSNCLIEMDNAKYDKVLPPDTPRKGEKKAALVRACAAYGIEVSQSATKAIL